MRIWIQKIFIKSFRKFDNFLKKIIKLLEFMYYNFFFSVFSIIRYNNYL